MIRVFQARLAQGIHGADGGRRLSGAAQSAAPEPTPISASMIEAARRERVVTFYTAMEIPVAEKLAEAFEARYPGITIRVRRSGAERVFERIGREQQIDLHRVDVVCSTNAGHFIHWKRNGLLAPYLPEDVGKNFPPEQVDPDGMYATAFATLSPIGYNTISSNLRMRRRASPICSIASGRARSSRATRTIAARS